MTSDGSVDRTVIPLFPLDVVLLPGRPLPLHIFEGRYRKLIRDVSAGDGIAAFGVILGHSAAGDADAPESVPRTGVYRLNEIGTLAEIVQSRAYPDGRYDLLTVGSRRFRVHSVDAASEPYLQAQVDLLDEPDGIGPIGALRMARRLDERYIRLLDSLTGGEREDTVSDDPMAASYDIAGRLQLTTADRQRLLAAATTADRLMAEIALLRRELAILRRTRSVPVPAHSLQVPTSRN